MNNLIGEEGINFNVKLDNSDLFLLGVVIFAAAFLAGVAIILFNKAVK